MSKPSGAPRFPASPFARGNARLRAAAVAAALVSLAFDGDFRGCTGSPSPPPAPLPMGPPPECLVDSDCEAPMCMVGFCTVTGCMTEPLVIDADGDGVEAPPCGDDCDDTNFNVSPFRPEMCNGVDDDCDDVIDERAPAMPRVFSVGADVRASGTAGDAPGVVLITLDDVDRRQEITARWFDLLDLTAAAPFAIATLAELTEGEDVAIAALPGPGGTIRVLWSSSVERAIHDTTLTLRRTDDDASFELGPTGTLATDVHVTRMHVVETGPGLALLLEEIRFPDPVRSLLVEGQPLVVVPSDAVAFDLAARDSRLYVPVHDDALAVLDRAGTEIDRISMPGRMAEDAVTAWNGRLVATSFEGGFFGLREITASDEVGASWRLATAGGDDLAFHPLERALGVSRSGAGLDVSLYDEAFASTEIYSGLAFSDTFQWVHRALYETELGLVVVASAEGGQASVVLVRCR